MILEDDVNDVLNGRPDMDVVVGILSSANHSCSDGCVVVGTWVGQVHDWVERTARSKVPTASSFMKLVNIRTSLVSALKCT